jgi:hypothetical protein
VSFQHPTASPANPPQVNTKAHSGFLWSSILAFVLLVCLVGIWVAVRAGWSRTLSDFSLLADSIQLADEAVRLTPLDPEGHYSRATLLANAGRLQEAIAEFESACALRPRDYYLWLRLAQLRDQAHLELAAFAACEESVRLAPYYGQPRWFLANLLFRSGRREEAFAEFRRAARSDQSLLPGIIDLAWSSTNGDPAVVEQIIQPGAGSEHIALAHFFAKHALGKESLAELHDAREASDKDLKGLMVELLWAGDFTEAHEVWIMRGQTVNGSSGSSSLELLNDGGFENLKNSDPDGFGWRLSRDVANLRASRDTTDPREGHYSLRLDWTGDSNPDLPIISQLVVVQPKTRYVLRFAARTQDIVTGGLPVVVVTTAGGKEGGVLGRSPTLPRGSSAWKDYDFTFLAGDQTTGVMVIVQRNRCEQGPCPIFGELWLDGFSIQKSET